MRRQPMKLQLQQHWREDTRPQGTTITAEKLAKPTRRQPRPNP